LELLTRGMLNLQTQFTLQRDKQGKKLKNAPKSSKLSRWRRLLKEKNKLEKWLLKQEKRKRNS
jgi:hypothetical protein